MKKYLGTPSAFHGASEAAYKRQHLINIAWGKHHTRRRANPMTAATEIGNTT